MRLEASLSTFGSRLYICPDEQQKEGRSGLGLLGRRAQMEDDEDVNGGADGLLGRQLGHCELLLGPKVKKGDNWGWKMGPFEMLLVPKKVIIWTISLESVHSYPYKIDWFIVASIQANCVNFSGYLDIQYKNTHPTPHRLRMSKWKA
jgi:hypothetical protein